MADRQIEVVVQIRREDVLAGRLWAHRRRGAESQTFGYDDAYLRRPDAYALDPALPLVAGPQHTADGRAIFGAFSDAAPDRWGRRLIARAERQRVRREGGATRSFGEIDYLLGVRDDLRQGALRFRTAGATAFLAEEDSGVPQLIELPGLLRAADRLERNEANEEELAVLLRGGSSLGGARPKAHVRTDDGRVGIAKLPRAAADEWDVMRWEAVALQLARDAGIAVPDFALHTVDGNAVLVVDRFDRVDHRRIGYVSAMTMLEATDGDHGSYLDIADVVQRHSPQASDDLRELWRRVAFSVLISNLDDHLRNHGFLRSSRAGWRLSPVFDLNPDPRPGPRHLQTAIDFDDTEARVDTLMAVAPEFRLSEDAARATLGQVWAAVSGWEAAARRGGVGTGDLQRMAPAFEHEQLARARVAAGR